jgi:long-chain fatty acid transport protein
MTRIPHRVLASAATTSILLIAHGASAGGIATARFGGEHGHPMTDEPTAVYYNPAGLGRSEGLNIFLDGTLALRRVEYEHKLAEGEPAEPADAQGANVGKAATFNPAVAPMAGASFKIPFEDWGLSIGAGFFVPFGGATIWPKNEDIRAADGTTYPSGAVPHAGADDGVQRWYSIEGTIRTMAVAGTVAISIVDRVHIGVSGNAYFSQIDTMRARNATGTSDINTEGRSYLEASGWHGGLGVGVLGEILDDELMLGASYQTQPAFGEMKLHGTLNNNFAGTPTPTDVEVTQSMPDILRFGASYRPVDVVEIRMFGDWTRWSVLERQCVAQKEAGTEQYGTCLLNEDGSAPAGSGVTQNIPRMWQDSFGIRAGMSYWALPEIELYLGVGYDSNAIPDERLDPALLDFHDLSAAIGGRFDLAEFLSLGATYTHFFYITRDTTGKAAQDAMAQPSRGPDAGGIYRQWVGVVNLNMQASYDPFQG